MKGAVSDCGVDTVLTRYDYGDGTLVTASGGWCAAKKVPFEMSFQLICTRATVRMMAEGYRIYWNDGKVEGAAVSDPRCDGVACGAGLLCQCVAMGSSRSAIRNLMKSVDSFQMIMAEQQSVDGRGRAVQYR